MLKAVKLALALFLATAIPVNAAEIQPRTEVEVCNVEAFLRCPAGSGIYAIVMFSGTVTAKAYGNTNSGRWVSSGGSGATCTGSGCFAVIYAEGSPDVAYRMLAIEGMAAVLATWCG